MRNRGFFFGVAWSDPARGTGEVRDARGRGATAARRMRCPRGMHDVFFGVKRAFHKSTWFGRAVLTPYGLTPSRFDVLYVLKKHPMRYAWQSAIRRILGVTAATTSIMVRAIEALGLVRRRKSDHDRRQIEVSLTDVGRELITRALKVLRKKRLATFFAKRLVSSTWWDEERSFADIDRFDSTLYYMRNQLKDTAMLRYSRHPDH